MSAPLPLLFKVASLPPKKSWTPQQFADAFVLRLTAESNINIAFFVSGSTAPTSDVGPWWNTGANPGWYIWDAGTGTYVPMPLPPSSLKYVLQVAAPDPALYDVWVVLDGAGKAQDIQTYSGGAWHSVWEDTIALYSTTTQMNTAISAAVHKAYPFRASKLAIAQTLTAGAGSALIVLENEEFDPDAVFAANVFTAPVNGYYHLTFGFLCGLNSGSPTAISIVGRMVKNGAQVLEHYDNESDSDTSGRTYILSCDVLLSAGDVIECDVEISTTGASTWDITNDITATYFSGFLTQKL